MNTRIRELRKALNLSQKDFAEQIGLGQTSVSNIEKSGTHVTDQTVKTICLHFCVNESWLRGGEGEMFIESSRKQKEFFELFNQFSPPLQDFLIQTARALLEAQNKLEKEKNASNQ